MSKGLGSLTIIKAAIASSGNRLLNSLWDYVEVIQKELKALEIIEKKEVNVAWLTCSDGLEGYNHGKFIGSYLTQEEYDLLKEVLE